MLNGQSDHWSNGALPHAERFSAFQDELDKTHFHWDLSSQDTTAFKASIRRLATSNVMLTQVKSDPVHGQRRREHIGYTSDGYYCLFFLGKGHALFDQGETSTLLQDGSVAIWDSTRPGSFVCHEEHHQYSMIIPHEVAKRALPCVGDICGHSVRNTAAASLLLSHMRQIHQVMDDVPFHDWAEIVSMTLELVSLAFKTKIEEASGTASQRALLARIQAYINDNLGDPELNPQKIAKAFKFSPRNLHRVFEQAELTVGGWTRQRRLEKAQQDLQNPSCRGLSITQIAMRNGFSDPSQFSRNFRAHFQESPRGYRARIERE